MLHSFWSVALSAAMGAGPAQYVDGQQQGYYPGPQSAYAVPEVGEGYYAGNGETDQLHPYDSPEPWLHGYIQEIPAYGGYGAFRPYNYKHVPSQSQAAAGWGMPPMMPYSQQFWHRYADEASMQQHLSDVGNNEYAAELARLRARHDFEAQRSGAMPAQNVQLQSYTTAQPIPMQQPQAYMRPTAPVVVPPVAAPNLQPVQRSVAQNQYSLQPIAQPQPQIQQPQPIAQPVPQPIAQPAPQAAAQPMSHSQPQIAQPQGQSEQQFEAMRRQIEMQQAKLRALESNVQGQRPQQVQQQRPAQKQTQKRRSSGIKPLFQR